MMECAAAVQWPKGTRNRQQSSGLIRCRTSELVEYELTYDPAEEAAAIGCWNSWVNQKERANAVLSY